MGSLSRAYESPSLLRELLAAGSVSPNSELDSSLGWRLLHKAAADNRCDVLSVLISSHAELEAQTKNGETALDLALARKSLEALQLLLEEGANANGGANKVESTVHAAVRIRKDDRFLHLLLDHGASCGTFDQHGDLPIHRACLEENVRAAQLLLSHNPHLCNRHGARGFTPLHIAANLGNSKLFLTVLRSGPRLDLYDIQERTPIDIVLAKQDTAILEGMGQWMVSPVLSSGGSCIKELLAMRQGQQFLRLLRTVDNEFQHNFGHNECNEETNLLDNNTNNTLLTHIRFSEKFDINEFVEIVLKACMTGLADEIISGGMVGKIADNFLKHIFVPQNEALLQEVMKLGMLWSAVVVHLENRIVHVYNQSLGERRKDGIKGLVCRNCLNDEGRVSSLKLHRLVAQLTQFWQLQWVGADDSEAEETPATTPGRQEPPHLKAMRDPVESLAVWCVLTGRLRLAPYFLRQEDFDTIPQALLLAKILRSLGRRRDIEDVYANKATKMAITCEGIAMQALRSIKDVDVTPNNCLTMELVMLPLDTFGGYSILELAAKGESSSFVIIDIVQEALNRMWYTDFFFARKDAHQGALIELAIACGFVPLLYPLLLFLMPRFRAHEPDYVRLRPSSISESSGNADGRCRAHEKRTGGSSEQDVALLQGGRKQQKQPEEEQQPRPRLSPLAELLRFYQIPCVKFRMHVTAHISFVLLLSFVVMFQMGRAFSVGEIICYLTLLGFLVEEINEMITSAREETIKNYFLDGWNVIDITAITCGFTAFALRIHNSTVHNPFQRYWSLVLLTTTCLVYWVRLLYISVVLESLGPKLKMMSLMVKKDFLPFLFILFVLMFGFGVTFHALQYPEGKSIQSTGTEGRESASEIILGMFRNTFYAIVGEYGLDNFVPCNISDITGPNINDGDEPDCVHPIGAVLVPTVYMVLYIVVMQILLLNVIVAMFSKTIDAIDSESKAMWQFEKFDLIEEFNTRSALPPPFNILSELRNLASFVWRRLCRRSGAGEEQRGQPAAAVVAAEAAVNSAAPASAGDTPHDCKVYLLSLYYQALAFRNRRSSLNGVVLDEEDLDEGNKIIFQQVNALNERMERFDRIEETVKQLESLVKELKAISLRGPSNISNKRASVLAMPYIEEGREEGP
uniref:ANK_REP_REGION domain-containing protein n=3 Tax=Macrostomum lignano TaxID=282301 RepID=A0A1I8J777_9PLAT